MEDKLTKNGVVTEAVNTKVTTRQTCSQLLRNPAVCGPTKGKRTALLSQRRTVLECCSTASRDTSRSSFVFEVYGSGKRYTLTGIEGSLESQGGKVSPGAACRHFELRTEMRVSARPLHFNGFTILSPAVMHSRPLGLCNAALPA